MGLARFIRQWQWRLAWMVGLCLVLGASQAAEPLVPGLANPGSAVAADEALRLYETAAWQDAVTGRWHLPVHLRWLEPEPNSTANRSLTALWRQALDLPDNDAALPVLRRRLTDFVADSERGKVPALRIGASEWRFGPSGDDGHARGVLVLPDATPGYRDGTWLLLPLANPGLPDPRPALTVQLVGPRGWSVLSDIDDTVKISHVRDKKALMRTTFTKDWQAVPGMAALYQRWAASGAVFHYISASPWPLHDELRSFLRSSGLPRGELRLRAYRAHGKGLLALLDESAGAKRAALTDALRTWPGRRFILVGDAGEGDPELYGELARAFPEQVHQILIRDLDELGPAEPRFQKAFAKLPAERWQVFSDPAQIKLALPAD